MVRSTRARGRNEFRSNAKKGLKVGLMGYSTVSQGYDQAEHARLQAYKVTCSCMRR